MAPVFTACIAAAAGIATAQPIQITADPALSTVTVVGTFEAFPTYEPHTSLPSEAPLNGWIDLELDDYVAPSTITINDFAGFGPAEIDLEFNDTAPLTFIEMSLFNLVDYYAAPIFPLGPNQLFGTFFSISYAPTLLDGGYTWSCGHPDAGNRGTSGNFVNAGVIDATLTGVVSSDGEVVNIVAILEYTVETSGGFFGDFATFGVSAVFVGAADAPPGCNPADIAPPLGTLDLSDVNAFISAFTSGGDAADIAEPFGVLDLADLNAFISAFSAGCP